jgi:hypothetical protein
MEPQFQLALTDQEFRILESLPPGGMHIYIYRERERDVNFSRKFVERTNLPEVGKTLEKMKI